MDIKVHYLLSVHEQRWIENARVFRASYEKYPAGIDHKLYIVIKDDELKPPSAYIKSIFDGMDVEFLIHPNYILDCGTQQKFFNDFEADLYCGIGNYTTFCADDWLLKMCQPFWHDKVGIVSPHGSYEQGRSSHRVNPHIRNSCFVVNPEVFHTLHWPVTNREESWRWEHGDNGISRICLQYGYKLIVVDKNGKEYQINNWEIPNGYRTGDQSMMLSRDNQTDVYASEIAKAIAKDEETSCRQWWKSLTYPEGWREYVQNNFKL